MTSNFIKEITVFDLLGGATKVRALVDRFYDLMDLEPEFAALRAMHAASLDGAREKLYRYLTIWTGGPNLYGEKEGPPCLRSSHIPFAISAAERDQWVQCMAVATLEVGVDEELREKLMEAFYDTADWMRNKEG
ncbi:MAG: group II truncated hemoglobin [Burkholderiaceae bacterium]|nr:group II truncated hemoglobin [Burkholderiaceae bacterium]